MQPLNSLRLPLYKLLQDTRRQTNSDMDRNLISGSRGHA